MFASPMCDDMPPVFDDDDEDDRWYLPRMTSNDLWDDGSPTPEVPDER